MESSRISKKNINVHDIRQSDNWAKYLEWLGWNITKTSSGIKIALRGTPLGTVTKIQRPQNVQPEDLKEIEKICKEKKPLFIKIEPNAQQNLKIFDKHGYTKSHSPLLPPTTIFIDLTKTKEELWNALSRSGKYSVNRAKREGAKVEFHKKPKGEIVETFYNITKQTAKKKRFYTPSLEDIRTKVKIFGGEAYIALVKDSNGEIAGGNIYLGFGKNIWFLHGGTSEKARKGKEGYELLWQSFLYFKKQGFKVLDLEGKDDERFPTFTKDWGGFSHFKEKFGGINTAFPHPRIKLVNPILKRLQKFYGTLPL